MAIIDIDRHIITDLMDILQKIEKQAVIVDRNFEKTKELTAKAIAYCDEKDCVKVRGIIKERAVYIRNANLTWKKIIGSHSEYKALLLHVVNRIKEVDTGKGEENDRR